MQVSRHPQLPGVLWPDQATSAAARFHLMPVDRAICTAVVSRDHNAFSCPEKSLDQFSVSSGVQGDNATSMVITDDALLGLAANHWVTANDFPHSPTPSSQWCQSCCDQQSFVPYSQQPAHFMSSTADSLQWYEGTRPKTRCPAIPNGNDTPAHVIGNVFKSLSTNGIDPWFLARHSQDDYLKNPEKVAADLNNRIVDVKSCMREPSPGYDARPLLPDHSVVNGGLPAYNWADPPHRHVTVGADYCGLPLADSQIQQSGNPKYSASTRQQATALSNRPTGADGGFLPAHSGSDYSSYSLLETSGEVVKTTDISTTVPAKPEQRVDEPASGSSSPAVSLPSTATFDTAVYDSDSADSWEDLEERVEEACAMVERVLKEREERAEFEANLRQRENAVLLNRPTGADGGFLPALSGSDYSSYSSLETSEEVVKTTEISTTIPAEPEQRVDEPASGSSSPAVSLPSTATFDTAVYDSDSADSWKDLEERVEEACAMVERVLREREERAEFEANPRQRENAVLSNRPTGAEEGFLPALSGSDYSSYSPLETSEEVVKTTEISTTIPAEPEQRVDEPASGSSSPAVSLPSTATFDTAVYDSDSADSWEDLEERVEEACAMVERVLREREEREEFEANLRRRENGIRADRKREQQAREAKEWENSQSWPTVQDAVTTENLWLCEHYQRHCRVKFECCNLFHSCHRCHNNSDKCSNAEAKVFQATHYKCSYCHHEEEIDENSQHCSNCKAKMSAYFCVLCKHFTSSDKNPYHCEKCGICRIHKDKSFHCDVCNVCLDNGLAGNHKCRPDSGHDACSICLEDVFSGCNILPCHHKIHLECVKAMLRNGIETCPVCRHPLRGGRIGRTFVQGYQRFIISSSGV